jgi:hypothetical protein
MSEDPYAVPEDSLVAGPVSSARSGLFVALLAVLGLASVISGLLAGANAGAVTCPTIDSHGAARVPDSSDTAGAVAWLAGTVLASSGIMPIRDRAASIVARAGLGLCGLVVALSAWVGSMFWASLPFAAEGCSGGDCWPSRAVGWSNSLPFILTGLFMILLASFCRSAWARRIFPAAVLLILLAGYSVLWSTYLFDIFSGPAPQWFVDYMGG